MRVKAADFVSRKDLASRQGDLKNAVASRLSGLASRPMWVLKSQGATPSTPNCCLTRAPACQELAKAP